MKAIKITPKLNQPRCATVTGGDFQRVLDGYNISDYLTRPEILDLHYRDTGEAMMAWADSYKGHDEYGIGFDFSTTAEEIEPMLHDSKTGALIRPATLREMQLSERAGAEGHIEIDGRRCYAI